MNKTVSSRPTRMGRAAAALLLAVAAVVPSAFAGSASAATDIAPGDAVWVGPSVGGGTHITPVYIPVPADTGNPGTADYWAYCIEHDVSLRPSTSAVIGDFSSYLGSNYFTDPAIQAKVYWIVTHAYPSVSVADLAIAAGAPGLTLNDAIEGAQYAIWRFTDLTFDASWDWASPNSEAVYWYLVNGAHANAGATPPVPADIDVSVAGPAAPGSGGTLVGPFTVSTNQETAGVASNPAYAFTDAAGDPIDPNAVVDGQQVYLDLRGVAAAGSATVTATVAGADGTGLVVSTPEVGSTTPTAASHRQSQILVAASTATTSAAASGTWAAAAVPEIGTTLTDAADEDHILAWNGGSLVDTISYSGLTAGQEYTVSGELMVKSDGSSTAITGQTTFTPTSAAGTVDVTFTVPSGYAGAALVAFETLYAGDTATGTPVAEHKDIDDVNQTVTLEEQPVVPAIGTTLLDSADQDHTLAWNGGTVIDTIAYTGLTPGIEHTVSGELMRKSDGSATGITATASFTPTSTNGSIAVRFTVPSGYAGESLVAFETLYTGSTASGTPVAEHKDIDDAAQTVAVEKQPAGAAPTVTGLASTGSALPVGLTAVAVTAVLLGAMFLIRRRRAHSEL
ncbi:VaFE repeat-containing surface-anchored protein [Microbacterium hydrocarbonoxydans]|uniref:VaFE repeat-containing surface-anchored protein n=1 Tax=Microbacterium hydrocarbonoxydans TaxID=273678 RepID=UPI003D97F253